MAYAGSSGRRPDASEETTGRRPHRGGGPGGIRGGAGDRTQSGNAPSSGGTAGWRAAAARLTSRGRGDGGDAEEPVARPRGRPFDRHLELPDVDWRRAGGFGAGLVLGALLGAGTALLLAPQSGEDMRRQLRRSSRRGVRRASVVWDDLGDELRFAGEKAGRRMRRRAERGRWQAEDLVDRVRPGRRRRAMADAED